MPFSQTIDLFIELYEVFAQIHLILEAEQWVGIFNFQAIKYLILCVLLTTSQLGLRCVQVKKKVNYACQSSSQQWGWACLMFP